MAIRIESWHRHSLQANICHFKIMVQLSKTWQTLLKLYMQQLYLQVLMQRVQTLAKHIPMHVCANIQNTQI